MRLFFVVAALTALVAGGPALADPDFITGDRRKPFAASDGRRAQQPMDDIVFPLDSSALLPSAQAQIASAAKWLAVHPGYRLVVEGRADSAGSAAYNQDLAARRGMIVRNHFIAIGVSADRIVLAIYGENTARLSPHPLDRRVVMFATNAPLDRVVAAELDRDALELVWTRNGTRFRETRGITPIAALVPRR